MKVSPHHRYPAPAAAQPPSGSEAPPAFARPLTLEPKRFAELSFASRAWTAIVPDSVTAADLLKPGYWKLNARRLSPRDTIDVVNDGFTFYARLLVVATHPSTDSIEVRELHRRNLAPPHVDGQEINGYAVSWGGGFDKWTVTRASDGHVMKKGIVSREEARYFVQTELTPRLAAGRAS